VSVDDGPIARRFRPVGMGRAYRIRKRFCHLRVVVSDELESTDGRRRRPQGAVTEAHPAAKGEAAKK